MFYVSSFFQVSREVIWVSQSHVCVRLHDDVEEVSNAVRKICASLFNLRNEPEFNVS